MVANLEKIWFGSSKGLVEIDKATKKHRLFSAKDGLLTQRVRDICLLGQKLWIALERDSGYLDLKTSTFTGVKGLGEVGHMAPSVRGNLWLVPTHEGTLRHLLVDNVTLTDIECDRYGVANWENRSCLAASEKYILFGTCTRIRSGYSGSFKGGISFYDIQRGAWDTVSADLPSGEVLAVSLSGNIGWVTGPMQWNHSDLGYVALVDLSKGQVIATCKVECDSALLLRGRQGMWVGVGSQLHYVDDKQAPAENALTRIEGDIPPEPGTPPSTKWNEEVLKRFGGLDAFNSRNASDLNRRSKLAQEGVSAVVQKEELTTEQMETLYSILDGRCRLSGQSESLRLMIMDALLAQKEVPERLGQEIILSCKGFDTDGYMKRLEAYIEKRRSLVSQPAFAAELETIFHRFTRDRASAAGDVITHLEILSKKYPGLDRRRVAELASGISTDIDFRGCPQVVEKARKVVELIKADVAVERPIGGGTKPSMEPGTTVTGGTTSPNRQEEAAVTNSESQRRKNTCIQNLRMIDGAKEQFAWNSGRPNGFQTKSSDIALYFKGGKVPSCPDGGEYMINAIGEDPTCSVPGHSLKAQR